MEPDPIRPCVLNMKGEVEDTIFVVSFGSSEPRMKLTEWHSRDINIRSVCLLRG